MAECVLQFLSSLSGLLVAKGQGGIAFAVCVFHGLIPLSLAATQERKNRGDIYRIKLMS